MSELRRGRGGHAGDQDDGDSSLPSRDTADASDPIDAIDASGQVVDAGGERRALSDLYVDEDDDIFTTIDDRAEGGDPDASSHGTAERTPREAPAAVDVDKVIAAENAITTDGEDAAASVSKYKDITNPNARMLNRLTDVGPEEFGKTLEDNGWIRIDKGPNIMYEKDRERYCLRGKASSHEGWTADY